LRALAERNGPHADRVGHRSAVGDADEADAACVVVVALRRPAERQRRRRRGTGRWGRFGW
jgi:hypothetical protein